MLEITLTFCATKQKDPWKLIGMIHVSSKIETPLHQIKGQGMGYWILRVFIQELLHCLSDKKMCAYFVIYDQQSISPKGWGIEQIKEKIQSF